MWIYIANFRYSVFPFEIRVYYLFDIIFNSFYVKANILSQRVIVFDCKYCAFKSRNYSYIFKYCLYSRKY